MHIFDEGLIWWLTVIEIPALTGLLVLSWKIKKEAEDAIRKNHELIEMRNSQLREGISAFKLEVAKNYASHGDLRELEERLVSHLLRIEAKLDATALKAESLSVRRE